MKYLILLIFICSITQATPQGDSFTYQGKLMVNNQPANGLHDFKVDFFDSQMNGVFITSQSVSAANVTDGLFNLQLDIGDMPFNGDELWVELQVAPIGITPLFLLQPRQLITNAPYAIQAKFVAIDGVNSSSIKNQSIASSDIANGAVGSLQIQDGSIINSDIAANTITAVQLATNSVSSFEIQNNAVTSAKIVDGTIVAGDVNSNSVQTRVTGTCPAGSSIRTIASDGSVTCETDDSGSGNTGWELTGNVGTTPGTNFIGTTDNTLLEFKVNNQKALQIIPYTGGKPNFIIGDNEIDGTANDANSILGGNANTISVGFNNTIVNGNANVINGGNFSAALGGRSNRIGQSFSVALGGESNIAGGRYSLVAGNMAHSRRSSESGDSDGDENTFIWSQTGLTSTGPDQVLFEAIGGFGIGTNAPQSPIHIKGQGTSTGSTAGSNEVVMTIEPNNNTSNVAAVINKLATNADSALIFSNNSQPEFEIRTTGGTVMDFNQYDSNAVKTSLVRLIKTPSVNRMDVNLNIEPFSNNTFNLGADSFRWSTIYSVNPLDVSSDRRLKDNITDVEYGLSEILALRPVSYNWKQGDKEQKHIGLIAQEVETIIPEIVSQTNNEKAMRSMRYSELIPVLIKATQEQQVLIEQQNLQIDELKVLVNSLLVRESHER